MASEKSKERSTEIFVLVTINEELERIRLEALKTAGYGSLKSLENPLLLDELSSILSVSYISCLEFARLSKKILLLNLEFMSIYSDILPLSWFSNDLLELLGLLLMNFCESFHEKNHVVDISMIVDLIHRHSTIESKIKVYLDSLTLASIFRSNSTKENN